MRSIALLSIATTSLLLAAPALAKGEPKLTAQQIVCQMTGDCDGAAGTDAQKIAKPEEAGFSFRYAAKAPAASTVKPVAVTPAPVRVSRGGYVAKPAPAPAPGRRHIVPVSSIAIPISFTRGSAELSPEAKTQANEFAAALTMGKLATRSVVIEGHTDNRGDRAMNLDLSERRARAVADYLISQHVDAGRIKAIGYGPDRPISPRDASSPRNRRVQFSFAD